MRKGVYGMVQCRKAVSHLWCWWDEAAKALEGGMCVRAECPEQSELLQVIMRDKGVKIIIAQSVKLL